MLVKIKHAVLVMCLSDKKKKMFLSDRKCALVIKMCLDILSVHNMSSEFKLSSGGGVLLFLSFIHVSFNSETVS